LTSINCFATISASFNSYEMASSMQIVAYYRVSTKRQGVSGLGLEGQHAALEQFAHKNEGFIIGAYQEVETGTSIERPELRKALAHAKRSKATLVVAKMDRLSRNATFLSALLDSGVSFLAVDNPSANELTIRILAAVAQEEAKAISERTKTALKAAKARGTKLGSARQDHWLGREGQRISGMEKARRIGRQVIVEKANEAYSDLYSVIESLRSDGMTFRMIAARLNTMGHSTRRGKAWNASQVMRVLVRLSKLTTMK
jgi:DNA invertase Pin-like site-specific DNA recombinase